MISSTLKMEPTFVKPVLLLVISKVAEPSSHPFLVIPSSVIVTVAVPSVVCAGTSSVDDGVNVSVNVSLFSTDVSSIVEIATVLDVSPLAKDTVVLMAV